MQPKLRTLLVKPQANIIRGQPARGREPYVAPAVILGEVLAQVGREGA
jgi:hypothetical protein